MNYNSFWFVLTDITDSDNTNATVRHTVLNDNKENLRIISLYIYIFKKIIKSSLIVEHKIHKTQILFMALPQIPT